MELPWFVADSRLVVILVVSAWLEAWGSERGHVEADWKKHGTGLSVASLSYGIGRPEPGGILFGPF
jgi:hypothetical protein